MFRSRSWFGGGWGRPKNPHSLDHLKYLYNVLARNHTVSEHNRGLLVESLRSIAEILIWGDQNDSSVFDFFLEKNMLSFFLRIMRQRSGGSSYVCVQLLQTLNILFENIRNETSLYYLLSNNHVNSIIVHKFDFSDEEVMAYYISFLKTLSFKLNGHTIHFFYNEHTNDFPLYTEAIKFFNHRESMVRIAVRTLTLNVYKVQDASMLKFIRDRTAAPYFSNLVWFIGKHILELDACVRNDADHLSQQKLDDLVAEHLDHLHYLNDILCLNIPDLNQVLTEHLLHKLLIPLYIYSLTSNTAHRIRLAGRKPLLNNTNSEQILHIETITKSLADILHQKGIDVGTQDYRSNSRSDDYEDEQKPRVSCVVALFLLSQVFLIITHGPLVHALAWIILHSDTSIFNDGAIKLLENCLNFKQGCIKLEFCKPSESLEKALAISTSRKEELINDSYEDNKADTTIKEYYDHSSCDLDPDLVSTSVPSTSHMNEISNTRNNSSEDSIDSDGINLQNNTGNYKERLENVPDSPIPDSGVEASETVPDSNSNITDEEKEKIALSTTPIVEHRSLENTPQTLERKISIETKPFLETILKSLDCSENDYIALFALCLLYALINNKGINPELLDVILMPAVKPDGEPSCTNTNREPSPARRLTATPLYSETLVDKLVNIIQLSCQPPCRVRLVSLELSLKLLSQAAGGVQCTSVGAATITVGSTLTVDGVNCTANTVVRGTTAPERRARAVELARQQAAELVRNYFKTEEIFLDMFEDEFCEMKKRPLNVEWLCMDAAILLPPTVTPMTGIAFTKRLPCGEAERARWAIRAYFLIRDLSLQLNHDTDVHLPLTNPNSYVQVGNALDLNNSDLIACTIVLKDGQKSRRFMVIDAIQIILVEPDQKRLGWGVAKLVGNLQDLEVSGDKDDSRCLHLRIHKPPSGDGGARSTQPLLQAKFVFDDHIRCMAAKQRLSKGRQRARQKKMQQIARLLELSGPSAAISVGAPSARSSHRSEHRPLFTSSNRVPGFAAALRRDCVPGTAITRGKRIEKPIDSDGNGSSGNVTPPVPGYEREAIGSYFSNSVKGIAENFSRMSSQEDKDSRRGSASSNSAYRRQSPASGVLRENLPGSSQKYRDRTRSREGRGSSRSRESSPRMPRPRSEEIPLESLSTTPNKVSAAPTVQLVQERPHSPKVTIQEQIMSTTTSSMSNTFNTITSETKSTLTTQKSEETSFISPDVVTNLKQAENKKKRGSIETI